MKTWILNLALDLANCFCIGWKHVARNFHFIVIEFCWMEIRWKISAFEINWIQKMCVWIVVCFFICECACVCSLLFLWGVLFSFSAFGWEVDVPNERRYALYILNERHWNICTFFTCMSFQLLRAIRFV